MSEEDEPPDCEICGEPEATHDADVCALLLESPPMNTPTAHPESPDSSTIVSGFYDAMARICWERADAPTAYRQIWHDLAQQADLYFVWPNTALTGALAHKFFLDIFAWEAVADLLEEVFPQPQGHWPAMPELRRFATGLLELLEQFATVDGLSGHDLTEADLAVLGGGVEWLNVGPDSGVAYGTPVEQLGRDHESCLTDLVEAAVLAGHTTDALPGLLLAYHLSCLRFSRRAEAMGAPHEAAKWLVGTGHTNLSEQLTRLERELAEARQALASRLEAQGLR